MRSTLKYAALMALAPLVTGQVKEMFESQDIADCVAMISGQEGCSGSHKMGELYQPGVNHGDCDLTFLDADYVVPVLWLTEEEAACAGTLVKCPGVHFMPNDDMYMPGFSELDACEWDMSWLHGEMDMSGKMDHSDHDHSMHDHSDHADHSDHDDHSDHADHDDHSDHADHDDHSDHADDGSMGEPATTESDADSAAARDLPAAAVGLLSALVVVAVVNA